MTSMPQGFKQFAQQWMVIQYFHAIVAKNTCGNRNKYPYENATRPRAASSIGDN